MQYLRNHNPRPTQTYTWTYTWTYTEDEDLILPEAWVRPPCQLQPRVSRVLLAAHSLGYHYYYYYYYYYYCHYHYRYQEPEIAVAVAVIGVCKRWENRKTSNHAASEAILLPHTC